MYKRRYLRWSAVGLLLLWTVAAAARQSSPAQQPLRIYLTRHGQTDYNNEGRIQGWTDVPLNATGREQAQTLKTRLTGISVDAVYSSNLRRSRETAEIVHGNVPVTSMESLNERRFGEFENVLTNSEYQRRKWIPDDSLRNGESLNAFRERVRGALDAIRKQHPSGSVLIVGHLDTNRMILSVLLGYSIDQMKSFLQDNAELYLIELGPGDSRRLWKLVP